MRRDVLLVDVALAVAVAILVLIVAPGLAIVAILAVGVLLVCGVSFLLGGLRSRSRARRPPPRRAGRQRTPRRPVGRP